jgi:hypothetical protein
MRRAEDRLRASIPFRIVRGRQQAWFKTVDVSRHAFFFETEEVFDVRSLVRLRFDACGQDFDAWGMVVRSGMCRGVRGTAVRFYARCETMVEIWDRFIQHLDQGYRAASNMEEDIDATYVVRVRDIDRLTTFAERHLELALPYTILTTMTRPEGSELTLRVDHPKGGSSFDLSAVVLRAWSSQPRGMEVSITGMEEPDFARFRNFIATGKLELPEWVSSGREQYAV